MDNQNHKDTWGNFTKFVLWGTVAVIVVLVLMAIFLLQSYSMRIVSVSENQSIEKRIAITPDMAKKYIALGFKVVLSEKYGEHLGFKDDYYKESSFYWSPGKIVLSTARQGKQDDEQKAIYFVEKLANP